jgi:hypothetical protein
MPILGGGGTTRRLGRIEARDAGWKLHTRMHGDGVDGRHMNRRGVSRGRSADSWTTGWLDAKTTKVLAGPCISLCIWYLLCLSQSLSLSLSSVYQKGWEVDPDLASKGE